MQLRDHEGVKGKRDAYPFDPRLLKVDDSYNVRDLTSPEAVEKLGELKESIRANGVRTPLEVRLDGEDVFIVAGHRRHKAVMDLIEEGEPIETVLVLHEAKGTNDAERTLNLVVSNSGEPLKPLEVAEVVQRLTAYGWEPANIAKRLGWKSSASVKQHLEMLAMPEGVKNHVKAGDISATLANKIAKGVDPVEAEKMIAANLAENRRIKGKHQKVTAKTIKRDAKPAPEAAPALPAEAAAPSSGPAESVAVFEQPPEPVDHTNGDAVEVNGDAGTMAENLGAPWEFNGNRIFDCRLNTIWEAGSIADGGGPERDYIDGDLDWESVVCAVNCHDDMLAALKHCVIERSDWLEEARAAIAKAEGHAP